MNNKPRIQKESSNGFDYVPVLDEAFNNRMIYITGEIVSETVSSFALQLDVLKRESNKPITIILNTPGGSVNAGLAIYDLIQGYELEINIICIGMAASMGAIILAGGQKGKRFIFPHSQVMIHEPSGFTKEWSTTSTAVETAEYLLNVKKELFGILAKHTNKTEVKIEKFVNGRDKLLSAEEAVQFGICDSIVNTF